MKAVRKIFSTLLIAALTAAPLLLVGCADQSGGAAPSSNANADGANKGGEAKKKKKPNVESGSSAIGGGVKAPTK